MKILPKQLTEVLGNHVKLETVTDEILFSVPDVTIDSERISIDDALTYSIAVRVTDDGTALEDAAVVHHPENPWWDGKPITITIYFEVYSNGGEYELFQLTKSTERTANELTREEYLSLIEEGVDTVVSDI